ncbi:hypothetical protein D3C71_2232950 [compost metagenome]
MNLGRFPTAVSIHYVADLLQSFIRPSREHVDFVDVFIEFNRGVTSRYAKSSDSFKVQNNFIKVDY